MFNFSSPFAHLQHVLAENKCSKVIFMQETKKFQTIVSCLSSQLPSQVVGWEVLSFEVNFNHLNFAGKKE